MFLSLPKFEWGCFNWLKFDLDTCNLPKYLRYISYANLKETLQICPDGSNCTQVWIKLFQLPKYDCCCWNLPQRLKLYVNLNKDPVYYPDWNEAVWSFQNWMKLFDVTQNWTKMFHWAHIWMELLPFGQSWLSLLEFRPTQFFPIYGNISSFTQIWIKLSQFTQISSRLLKSTQMISISSKFEYSS